MPEKIKGKSDGTEAKKDAELVLYEFIGMLVRIAFWRCNPSFGNFVDKDGDGKKDAEEFLPVPACLSKMLNEVILPHAKRENSGAFRDKQMQDPEHAQACSDEYKDEAQGAGTTGSDVQRLQGASVDHRQDHLRRLAARARPRRTSSASGRSSR